MAELALAVGEIAPDERIGIWASSLPPGLGSQSPVHHLYTVMYDLFRSLRSSIKGTTTSKGICKQLERCFSSLILWSRDQDVARLDDRLATSKDLHAVVITLLASASSVLTDRILPLIVLREKPAAVAKHANDTVRTRGEALAGIGILVDAAELAKEHDASRPDSLEKAFSNFKTSVQALVDLGPALEDPYQDSDSEIEEEFAEVDQTQGSSANIKALIKYIFPKCQDVVATGVAAALHSNCTALEEKRAAMEKQTSSPVEPKRRIKGALTTLFTDSGLGTSLGTRSLYAETVRQYQGNSDLPVSIQLPSLPQTLPPFNCPVCQISLFISTQREWKQHLMHDIKPYMCVQQKCKTQFKPFENKASWISHMRVHHEESELDLACPFCEASAKDMRSRNVGFEDVMRHMSNHLEPLAAELMVPGVSFISTAEDSLASTNENDPVGSNVSERSLGTSRNAPNDGARVINTKAVKTTNKPVYIRPKLPRIFCNQCNEHAEGFRGEHELRRHVVAKHTRVKKYVCRDPAIDGIQSDIRPINPLDKCKSCMSRKHYGAYYNAAAHLRRAHFNPKPIRGKARLDKPEQEKRGGIGGGNWPAMSDLKLWFEEIVVEAKDTLLPDGMTGEREDYYFLPDEVLPKLPGDILAPGEDIVESHIDANQRKILDKVWEDLDLDFRDIHDTRDSLFQDTLPSDSYNISENYPPGLPGTPLYEISGDDDRFTPS